MTFRLFRFMALPAIALIIAGCARFPEGSTSTDLREMTVRIELGGPVNENDYYFVPIDTVGGGPGPVPVFPGIVSGEGWLTGSSEYANYNQTVYYVQYHQHQYTVYKVTSLQPFVSEPAGSPVRSTQPESGNTLEFTLDLNAIGATGESVDVNIITTDQPLAVARLLDGLGRTGSDFINIDIVSDRTVTNFDSLTPETAGDVLDQNLNTQPGNSQTNPLDITDWTITLDM